MKKTKKIIFWPSVVVIGIALGLTLQFVRAWTEPGSNPPAGNVGATINTGKIDQTKGDKLSGKINAKDFCLNSNPATCLSTTAMPPCRCINQYSYNGYGVQDNIYKSCNGGSWNSIGSWRVNFGSWSWGSGNSGTYPCW